jgi:hypothetical protein
LRYFLDTEFNGFGGELISLALVREDGLSLYLLYSIPANVGRWVATHVIPALHAAPPNVEARRVSQAEGARALGAFLGEDPDPEIIADWPDDISYFCRALMTGPGAMAPLRRLRFEMERVETAPHALPGSTPHNAWWDAMALRERVLRPPMRALG